MTSASRKWPSCRVTCFVAASILGGLGLIGLAQVVGPSTIMLAVYANDLGAIEDAIQAGGDVNRPTMYVSGLRQGEPYWAIETPLFVASQKGNREMVRTLLEAQADYDRSCTDSETPLSVAVRGDELGVVQLLLAAGADPLRVTSKRRSSLQWAAIYGSCDIFQACFAACRDRITSAELRSIRTAAGIRQHRDRECVLKAIDDVDK